MKALRVVHGLHAGAWLTLSPGRYRIGNTDDAASVGQPGQARAESNAVPIRLYDWTGPPLLLRVDAQGRITADQPDGPAPWPDLQPRRRGEVVLCTGDADGSWPSDARLMAMLRPAGIGGGLALAGWARSWGARAVVVGAGLLVAVGALYGQSGGGGQVSPAPQPAVAAQSLSRNLAGRGLDELQVRQDHSDVVLSGLVHDARQGQAVRLAVADVERQTGIVVMQTWEVADVIAATIESALRVPGLHAAYLGAGRFAVSGTVPEPVQVLEAAPQLRKDLGANVRAIEFELSRIRTSAAFSAAVAADALHYSERPDGAKVFAEKKI